MKVSGLSNCIYCSFVVVFTILWYVLDECFVRFWRTQESIFYGIGYVGCKIYHAGSICSVQMLSTFDSFIFVVECEVKATQYSYRQMEMVQNYRQMSSQIKSIYYSDRNYEMNVIMIRIESMMAERHIKVDTNETQASTNVDENNLNQIKTLKSGYTNAVKTQ